MAFCRATSLKVRPSLLKNLTAIHTFIFFPYFLLQMPLWRNKTEKKFHHLSGHFCYRSVKSPMHYRVKFDNWERLLSVYQLRLFPTEKNFICTCQLHRPLWKPEGSGLILDLGKKKKEMWQRVFNTVVRSNEPVKLNMIQFNNPWRFS